MHLFGFTVEIYYDARPCERQTFSGIFFCKYKIMDARTLLVFRLININD